MKINGGAMMKTLIVYGTKYGCTEKCATMLAKKLTGTVDLRNLKTAGEIDLSQYDTVIIGGSVYMGQIRKEVSEFCTKQLHLLQGKKLGLFICCMRDGELAETQLTTVFPKELVANAVATGFFGGEFTFKKMNFLERMIVKKVSKVDKDASNIQEENITAFAKSISAS
jgi:menaquinone-dependent protoporphyrinogen oxidase